MNRIELELSPIEHQLSESYNRIKANLQFYGEGKKVIAIASCSPDEGESEISLRLAVSFAEEGKKTLLIDGNMRTSSVIDKTKAGNKTNGLLDFLKGDIELKDIIYITDITNLCVIYSGESVSYAADLLSKKRFKQMIEALRKIFDHIIISTPPVGRVIDGVVISESCDGSVLVIGTGITDYRIARDVKEQLERSGTPVIGAILNKAEERYVQKINKYGDYGKSLKGGTEQ